MVDTVKCSEVIADCIYSKTIINVGSRTHYCDYICMTGYRRGCNLEECTRYISRGDGKCTE